MKAFLMWVDTPEKLVKCLAIAGAVLVLLDLVIDTYPYVPRNGVPMLYAILGFLGFGIVALMAYVITPILRRPDNYYSAGSLDDESAGPASADRTTGDVK